MFLNDLNQFYHQTNFLPESILFYNYGSMGINDYEYLAKYIKHIFIVQTNGFNAKKLYIRLRYYNNIHFLLPSTISNFVFDVITTDYLDQRLQFFIQNNRQNYKYFHIINQYPNYKHLLQQSFGFYQNLDYKEYIPENITNNQTTEEVQVNQQNYQITIDNPELIIRNSNNSYNLVYTKSYKEEQQIKHISIIIPTFNQSEYTIKCFKSIDKYFDQKYKIKIYWIDNGSTKKQIGNVRRACRRLKHIQIIQLFSIQQLGFVKATNLGIKQALKQNPDYIILQNNDTEVTSGWLQPMIKALESDDKILVAGPITNSKLAVQGFKNIKSHFIFDLFDFDQYSTEQIVQKLHQTYKDQYILIDRQHQIFIPAFYCSILKSSSFNCIGFLDQIFGFGYGDDVDYFHRLFQNNFKFAFVPESYVLHNHRTTFSSIFSQKEIKSTIKAKLKQIQITNQLTNTSNKKSVIYTCITGNYDNLLQPTFIDTENFDYVCFTNSRVIVDKHPWKIINISQFEKYLNYQNGSDNTRLARFFKTHPHLFFKNYQYSIWIDGNIDLISSPMPLINQITPNHFILMAQHPLRTCVYEQIKACLFLNKDDQNIINMQQDFLKSQNYPQNNGMVQSNFMIRKHNDQNCKNIMQQWWKIIKQMSKRDQLSFNYVMWKNNSSYLYLPWDSLANQYLTLGYKHEK